MEQAVTIKHIALALGLAHSTVSRALNGKSQISEETRQRVREAAAGLGYLPNLSARLMRGDAGPQVGLLIPDVQNDFFSTVAKVLTGLCREAGLRVLLSITEDDPATEEEEIRGLLEARVGGIIATLTNKPTPATLNLLRGKVCIQIGDHVPIVAGPVVAMADEYGCRLATSHLLELGHRRIGYLGLHLPSSAGQARLQGYLAAHARHGVPPFEHGTELVAPRQQSGLEGARRLLSLPDRPTALVVGGSELMIGTLAAIQKARLAIPSDISIVGYGDPVWFDLLTPALTTMSLPIERLAQEAAQVMFRHLRTGADPDRTRQAPPLRPRLIVRQSTARLGA